MSNKKLRCRGRDPSRKFAAKFLKISRRECLKIFYGDPFGEDFLQIGVPEGSGPSSHTLGPLGSLGLVFSVYKTQRGLRAGGGRADLWKVWACWFLIPLHCSGRVAILGV